MPLKRRMQSEKKWEHGREGAWGWADKAAPPLAGWSGVWELGGSGGFGEKGKDGVPQ